MSLVVGVLSCSWGLLLYLETTSVMRAGPWAWDPGPMGPGPWARAHFFLNSLFVGDDSCGWGLVLQLGSCLVVGVWICSWGLVL